jgi:hypothetical protein
MSTPEHILLFDESVEYLDMPKEKQNDYFKEKMEKLNPNQVKERIALKIQRHRDRMVGALKPSDNMTSKEKHVKKRRDQWSSDPVSNVKTNKPVDSRILNNNSQKKNEIINEFSQTDNKNMSGKNVKYYSGADKKEPPKVKKIFQEGQSTRGSTKKNGENTGILNYVEEKKETTNDSLKNSKIHLEIKESNKKLKKKMKKITEYSVIKGYQKIPKKDITPDGISRIGKINFQRSILTTRQKKLNPTLIKPPSPISNKIKRKPEVDVKDSEGISGHQSLKVLKWHEQRLDEYKQIIDQQDKKIKEMQEFSNNLLENLVSTFYFTQYTDFNTVKHHDNMIRKIQSTWRFYKFKKSIVSVKIQRWYRYLKNVKAVSSEVQEFITDIMTVKQQTSDISKFLLSLDSKKALPLERLKIMKQKLNLQMKSLNI